MKKTQQSLIILAIVLFFSPGCSWVPDTPRPPLSEKTNAELIQLLDTFRYDDDERSEYEFYMIVAELEKRGAAASEAAPTLARMIAFDGSTSVTASYPLAAMGASAQAAIPDLLQNLDSERADVREHSIAVLGFIGEPASCAVPKIAPFLWDPDPLVRSVTVVALTKITQIMLVESDLYQLDFTDVGGSVPDGEDANVSRMARAWWLDTGQHLDWTEKNCTLP